MYLELSDSEKKVVQTLIQYLKEYPDQLVWRKKQKLDLNNHNDLSILSRYIIEAKNKPIIPSVPQTIPDNMVSNILESFYGYSPDRARQMKAEHQHTMAAENAVGALLELYIATEAKRFGWVQCVGNLVKSVDFIRNTSNGWTLLQVKNRDNSENSSSSSVRKNTAIIKWFRTFSRTGKTNWTAFPDHQLSGILNEQKFEQFVKSYLNQHKS